MSDRPQKRHPSARTGNKASKAVPVDKQESEPGQRPRLRRKSPLMRKIRNLTKLALLLVIGVGGWLGYGYWTSTDGENRTLEGFSQFAAKKGDQSVSAVKNIDVKKFLKDLKEKLISLEDYFRDHPDAKPIENQEQLEEALAQPDPETPDPTPAEEAPAPSPKMIARAQAQKLYNEARAILRTWSSGQDKKLHQATKRLDQALEKADIAEDSRLIQRINEMRYFCLKSHSTR
ncbi:MAG: hypothetical protein QF752_05530 [Planctomycetota bacterium]|nr:hypothetical protein [Planctomycetota bacterium]